MLGKSDKVGTCLCSVYSSFSLTLFIEAASCSDYTVLIPSLQLSDQYYLKVCSLLECYAM